MESALLKWNYRERSCGGERYKIALVPGLLFISCLISNMSVSSLHSPLNKGPGQMVCKLQFPNSRTLIKRQIAWYNLSRFRSHKGMCHCSPLEREGFIWVMIWISREKETRRTGQRGTSYRASLSGSICIRSLKETLSQDPCLKGYLSLILLPSPLSPLCYQWYSWLLGFWIQRFMAVKLACLTAWVGLIFYHHQPWQEHPVKNASSL